MNRVLLALLIAATVGALGWGLNTVGGPAFARMEKNDRQRIKDLQTLGRYYACLHRKPTEEDVVVERPSCLGLSERELSEITDPKTEADYAFAFDDDDHFRVCADFEIDAEDRKVINPAARRAVIVFEGNKGCVFYQRVEGKWFSHSGF